MSKWILSGVLLYDGIIDGIWHRIPLKVNAAAAISGILYGISVKGWIGMKEALSGILIGMLVLAVSLISKETVGKGDGLLFMMTGCWIGGRENFLLLIWTCFFAGMFAGGLLVLKKAGRKTEIPIAPFVLAVYVGRMMM